jgi:hypothetical protein
MDAPDALTERDKQLIAVLLAQFNACRNEIQARSAIQAALLNLNIIATGALAGYYFANHADPLILLIIPLLSPMLGIIWADHAINIGNIGRFIQNSLMPRLSGALDYALPDYEVSVRAFEGQSGLRLMLLISPMLLLFAGIPVFALLLAYSAVADHGDLFWALSAIGALLILIFGGYALAILFGWIWRTDPAARGGDHAAE